jgi:protein-S-isoprenylcysteine O-methyltransferase Ste14
LGVLSIPVAVVAQIYGVSMIVNLLYPRPANDVEGWMTFIVTFIIFLIGLVLSMVFGRRLVSSIDESSPLIQKD